MSEVIKDTVEGIAKLARLGLTESELAATTADLNGIFAHFSQVQEIDAADVPTSDDVTGLTNITRADEAQPETLCAHRALLDRAPDTHKNQIKVGAVL